MIGFVEKLLQRWMRKVMFRRLYWMGDAALPKEKCHAVIFDE